MSVLARPEPPSRWAGVFYIGLGDQFDGDKVTAIGPLGLEYLDPGDDPGK